VIEWIFGCLNKIFPPLRSPVKLYLGIGNIGTTIAAATVFYNAVSFQEPNMSSQKDVCHPDDRNSCTKSCPRNETNTRARRCLLRYAGGRHFHLRKQPRQAQLGERWQANKMPRFLSRLMECSGSSRCLRPMIDMASNLAITFLLA
jgi:hypothetical protein